MKRLMSEEQLALENAAHTGSGGRSQDNSGLGFKPAFRDFATGIVYPACFADGRPAPFHLLDGLPDDMIVARAPHGRVLRAKASLVSGFARDGRFYTRAQAAAVVKDARRA